MLPSILFALMLAIATPAFADNLLSIEQVPTNAQLRAHPPIKEPSPDTVKNNSDQPDHQNQVLNDPVISDYGRANSLVNFSGDTAQAGGNTVTVNQDAASGTGNTATIHQKGNSNISKVQQKGHSNDLYVDQVGSHNASSETQEGEHNHKVKVQNGVREEFSDDPYDNNDQ